jgi:hypothetical protein
MRSTCADDSGQQHTNETRRDILAIAGLAAAAQILNSCTGDKALRAKSVEAAPKTVARLSYAYTVGPPIPNDEPVPIHGEPNQLLKPNTLMLFAESNGRTLVDVQFLYISPNPGEYKIAVQLQAFDEDGVRLSDQTQLTVDQRVLVQERPTEYVSIPRQRSTLNAVLFQIDQGGANHVHHAIVTFSTY